MPTSTSLPVKGSRPAIVIDGRRNDTLTSALLDLEIADSTDGLAHCDMTFGNWGGTEHGGFQFFDRQLLDFGKALTVSLEGDALFDGRISAITATYPDGGPPQIGVCGEDRLQDLRMTRRTRSFPNASLADVLQQVAGDHGLQPQIDVTGATYRLLAQVNQSDLAFIRDLARREDVQVWVDGKRLNAVKRASRNGGTLQLSWAGQLREFNVSADLAHQRTKLVGSGWSVPDKQTTKHEADEAAIRSELNGGTSGAATLQRAFGARVDTLAHGLPAADAEARALAEASFRYLARRFVVGHGVAETQVDLRVGAKLKITGLGPMFEGEYVVTDTHIRFDAAQGLRTEFTCDRPAIGSR